MVSIAFVGRGRYRLLKQTLESLYANTDRKQFNVCFCADQEDDFRCTHLLKKYAEEEKNFCLIEVSNSSHVLAQLKNLAVFWSRQRFGEGDWLYISDSDVYFSGDWLSKLTAAAEASESSGFRLIGGQIHPFHQPVMPPRNAQGQMEFDIVSPNDKRPAWTEHSVLDGPSWLMRWKTWREVGPFSRNCAPGVCQSEDANWCSRLTAKGGRIGVAYPPVVVHCGLTNSNGELAPGADLRRGMIPEGVLVE